MRRLQREAVRQEAQQQQEAAQRAKQAAVAHARLQAEEEGEEIAQQAAAAQAGQQQFLQDQSDMDSVKCIGDGGHMGHVDCHENAMYSADIAVQQVCSGSHFASFFQGSDIPMSSHYLSRMCRLYNSAVGDVTTAYVAVLLVYCLASGSSCSDTLCVRATCKHGLRSLYQHRCCVEHLRFLSIAPDTY